MRRQRDPVAGLDATWLRPVRHRSPWLPVAIVGIVALASLVLILWVHRQWEDAFRLSVSAIDSLSQSRVYAAEAGALAEKVLAHDETVRPSDVGAALDRAFLSLADCRTGTSRLAGVAGVPPAAPEFLAAVAVFEQALQTVRSATEARLAAAGPPDRAGEIRQRQALHGLKRAAAELDLRLSRALAGQLQHQQRLLALLMSLWAAFALGLTGLVWASLRERHAAEQEVTGGLELLRTIVECAQVAVLVMDREWKIRVWNGSAERTFGWKREEVYGKPIPFITSDQAAEAAALFARLSRGETLNGVEVRRVRKDGTPIELNLYAAPIRDASGAISGIVSMLADISAHKRQEDLIRQSEERHRQVVENSPLGIFIRVEGYFHYLNPAAVRLFGANSAEDLIGTLVWDRFHPDSRAVIGERMRRLAEEQQLVTEADAVWLRMDGSSMSVEVSAVPYRHGDLSGVLVFFSDTSAMRLAQEEKRKVEEQFFQAQKMESVGRLAGGVAHDFNNLLTVINGYGNLLSEELAPADARHEFVDQILQAGEKAAGLTRQLLAFSRKQIIAPVPVCLNDVVREAEKMFRRLIGEDIELATDLAPDLWPVMADPGQVHQVLLNLVVNARHAMPSGGRVVVATRNLEVEGPQVELTVSDNGTGMSDEVLQHMFEPFFTTKERGSGTGLGLSTVYGIVRQSGGSISVESAPGRGSTFKVLLPRYAGERKAVAGPPAAASPRASETILIAEDNPEVRRLACDVLGRCGYRILDAGDAATALKLVEDYPGPIHLLLTDVVMPGASGKELADLLAERHRETRCLYMSGYTADVIGRRGVLDAGMDFLPKPFTPASLEAKVRMVLDKPPG